MRQRLSLGAMKLKTNDPKGRKRTEVAGDERKRGGELRKASVK